MANSPPSSSRPTPDSAAAGSFVGTNVLAQAASTPTASTPQLVSWPKRDPYLYTGFGKMIGYLPKTGDRTGELSLQAQRIRAVVWGGMARTEVQEEFYNEKSSVLEGCLTFPLPAQASLARLTLWKGGRPVEGRVFELDRAKLLSWGNVRPTFLADTSRNLGGHGGELFSTLIYPIHAKSSRKVTLTYDQPLNKLVGREVYRYPFFQPGERRLVSKALSIEVMILGATQSIRRISTPGYVTQVRQESDRFVVEFESTEFTPKQDFVVEVETRDNSTVDVVADGQSWREHPNAQHHSSMMFEPLPPQGSGGSFGYFAVRAVMEQPSKCQQAVPLPMVRLVVLDKSDAQSSASLHAQRRIVEKILASATPDESYAFLACDSACQSWPSSGTFAGPKALSTELPTWTNGIRPSGALDLEGAAAHAFGRLAQTENVQLIWLSSGQARAGDMDHARLTARVKQMLGKTPVDMRVIGVGHHIDDVMLTALASATDATYDVLDLANPIEQKLVEIVNGLREPKIAAIQVALPGETNDVFPKHWPALRPGQPLQIVGRLLAPVHGTMKVSGRSQGCDYSKAYPLSISPADAPLQMLTGRLWVHSRLRQIEEQPNNGAFEFGVLDLAKAARVASRYTTWILFEDRERYASLLQLPYRLVETNSTGRAPGALPTLPDDPLAPSRVRQWLRADNTIIGASGQKLHAFAPRGVVELRRPTHGATETEGVARMIQSLRAGTRTCYQRALESTGDWVHGRLPVRMRTEREGLIENLTVDAKRTRGWSAIQSCLRMLAASTQLAPSQAGGATADFDAEFSIDFGAGLGLRMQLPDGSSSKAGVSVMLEPGDERWRSLTPVASSAPSGPVDLVKRARVLLGSGQFGPALEEARQLVEQYPSYVAGLHVLFDSALANMDIDLAGAALESRLVQEPDDDSTRWHAIQTSLAQGDERRACAHVRSLSNDTANDQLATLQQICRDRWLIGPPLGIRNGDSFAALIAETTPRCRPFVVRIDCDATAIKCPSLAVLTPLSDVLTAPSSSRPEYQASELSFWPKTDGTYRVILLGGDVGTKGRVSATVHGTTKEFEFVRGEAIQTAASVTLLGSVGPSTVAKGLCADTN